jgi:hypothetical protein
VAPISSYLVPMSQQGESGLGGGIPDDGGGPFLGSPPYFTWLAWADRENQD